MIMPRKILPKTICHHVSARLNVALFFEFFVLCDKTRIAEQNQLGLLDMSNLTQTVSLLIDSIMSIISLFVHCRRSLAL